jgi:hypothetical protein
MDGSTGYNPLRAESLEIFRGIFGASVYRRKQTMNLSEKNDRLSPVLRTWKVSPPADPTFRPAVWDRIKQRSRETWSAYLRGHLVAWSMTAGLAFVTAAWAGHSVAQAKLAASRQEMVVSYLGELDPRVMARLSR